MRPRRSTIPFLVFLAPAVFIGGAPAPAVSATGPLRAHLDLQHEPPTAAGGSGGSIVGWGGNDFAQTNVPAPNSGFVAVAAHGEHSLGLKGDGSIVAWGRNDYGQTSVPAPNKGFVGVATGEYHSLGLKGDGSIVAWGYNNVGQLDVPLPNTDFVAVAAGGLHSLALKADGSILPWGWNYYGQINVPAPNSGFVAVAAGYAHSLGVKAGGAIVAWGYNPYGQTSVPAPNTGFVDVAGGWWHSLGLKADGSIVGWGGNFSGQTNVPVPNTGFVGVAAGGDHSLGLKADGSIVAWGRNDYGQTNVPPPNSGFVAVAAGGAHSLGLKDSNFPACCFSGGNCSNLDPTDCANAGGTPQGAGTTCADTACPCTGPADCPDDGLFCNGSESCNLTSGLCTRSGSPCLPNQVCDEAANVCLNFGACCLEMGTVCFLTNDPDCVDPPPDGAGGVFLGAGSTCPTQIIDVPFLEGDGCVFVHHIKVPRDCPVPGPPGAVAGCPPSGPYTDPWVSDASAGLCHNFGVTCPDTDPIPAGFFDPGSDPFTSTVCLRGVPLGNPQYGDADTLISRSADPFDRCDLPSGTPSTVNIEIVALSLESVNPITVTHNGGQNPEAWEVTVDLSPGGLPPGTPPRTLTATKTHCNGGTYTSVLYVQPRFTFTKVSNPSEVRVLDTGMTGTPPVELVQSDPHPWVSDIDPFLGAMVDRCSDFHANISENNPVLECDCNANSRRDLCDIEDGVSLDCNANGVPDSCDLSNGTSQDVNGNGVPDECEQRGACCDGSPQAVHCTDGTYPEDCVAPKSWVKGSLCSAVPSVCPALTLGSCCNTLAGTCRNNATAADCSEDQRVFTLDGTCANVPCAADLGACCDHDTFGGCTDTTNAECVPGPGNKLEWTKLASCANIDCLHEAIPTVSEWGLVVLTLLLLIGAKIYFARRETATAS